MLAQRDREDDSRFECGVGRGRMRAAAGSVRSWRIVRGVFRTMSDERGAGWPLGESWRVRAGVPHALLFDCGWKAGGFGRPEVFAESAGSCRLGNFARVGAAGRSVVEN